jgi:hypothetical protein
MARLADVGSILLAGQPRFFEAVAVPDEPGRSDLDACSGKLPDGDVILLGHAAK